MDWFGIVLFGSILLNKNNVKVKTLDIGDMIGYMAISDSPNNKKHELDILGDSDGYVALINFGELRQTFRRYP